MINVLASIKVKPEKLDEFVQIFKANVPAVLAEDGCIDYIPAMDEDTGLDAQTKDATVVTVIEKWESVDALKAHLAAPHMGTYREDVKDMVEKTIIKVLKQV
jgi:quinol monooxygenase YgiN